MAKLPIIPENIVNDAEKRGVTLRWIREGRFQDMSLKGWKAHKSGLTAPGMILAEKDSAA